MYRLRSCSWKPLFQYHLCVFYFSSSPSSKPPQLFEHVPTPQRSDFVGKPDLWLAAKQKKLEADISLLIDNVRKLQLATPLTSKEKAKAGKLNHVYKVNPKWPLTYNLLLKQAIRTGQFTLIPKIWETLEKNLTPDIIHYNLLMEASNKNKNYEEAIQIYNKLKSKGLTPQESTYVQYLHALSSLGLTSDILTAVEEIKTQGLKLGQKLLTPLMQGYGKRNDIINVERIFQSIENPDIRSYTVLIDTYVWNQLYEKAYQAIIKMIEQGVQTDHRCYRQLIIQTENKPEHRDFNERVIKLKNTMLSPHRHLRLGSNFNLPLTKK